MKFVSKLYNIIKGFFEFLSFKRKPNYSPLNNDNEIDYEEIHFMNDNMIR